MNLRSFPVHREENPMAIAPTTPAAPVAILLLAMAMAGCAARNEPLPTVPYVDLEKFMGDWYVIASIPTFIEKDAYNAVETYELREDGAIATTFVFRQGGFAGKEKTYTPVGYVEDKETNAVWGMQFIWPVRADYRIVYLTNDYSQTIIARNKRDFVWIMARTPEISAGDYEQMTRLIEAMGYDLAKLRKVPQQWQAEQ
jgi:apolipoprotein D and lipocalin family protein